MIDSEVPPTNLGVQVIGWLLLPHASHWLLWAFSMLEAPANIVSGVDRVINYSAAIRIDKRLACQRKVIQKNFLSTALRFQVTPKKCNNSSRFDKNVTTLRAFEVPKCALLKIIITI